MNLVFYIVVFSLIFILSNSHKSLVKRVIKLEKSINQEDDINGNIQ